MSNFFYNAQRVVNVSPDPTGNTTQTFLEGQGFISFLVVSPTNVVWYASQADALAGTNPLSPDTPLVNGATYYAVNITNGCPSNPLAVTVTITLGNQTLDSSQFTYAPNPTNSILNISYSENITKIEVINLLGQIVITSNPFSKTTSINMQNLPNETYLVKVYADQKIKTVKIIKN